MANQGLVIYDFMAVRGGAEKLTQTLLNNLPRADCCTAFINRDSFPDLPLGQGANLIDLRAESAIPFWRILKVIWSFEWVVPSLDDYEWVVFSGIYAPLAVRRRSRRGNILYCHTIPRFCFDLKEYYMRNLPWYARPVFAALIASVTRKYANALARMDIVVANSENVRQRLLRSFGRDAVIVHPPVDSKRYRWLGDGDYYVSLARLEDFKRVDMVIKAFLCLPRFRLIVTSGGAMLQRLKQLASGAKNITFTGWLSEEELCLLVGNARAAVYVPIDEDFGMSPVEAMAAGKPVIGVAEGGLLETVLDGETGLLIKGDLTSEKICHAVRQLEEMNPPAMREACEQRASLFDESIFVAKMSGLIDGYQPRKT